MKSSLALLALTGLLSSVAQASSHSEKALRLPIWSRRSAARDHNTQEYAARMDSSSASFEPFSRRQVAITDEDTTNPIQAAKDVQAIPYLANNVRKSNITCPHGVATIDKSFSFTDSPIHCAAFSLTIQASGVTDTADQVVQGDSDEGQLPWNDAVYFFQSAATNVTTAGGWEELPDVQGFDLNRTWEVVPGAVMPFYSLSNLDPTAVKRAVITWPGK
jgi:hypothetical protein